MSFLQDIYGYIKSGETDTENLGLEIEHFVVDKNGSVIEVNPGKSYLGFTSRLGDTIYS